MAQPDMSYRRLGLLQVSCERWHQLCQMRCYLMLTC